MTQMSTEDDAALCNSMRERNQDIQYKLNDQFSQCHVIAICRVCVCISVNEILDGDTVMAVLVHCDV